MNTDYRTLTTIHLWFYYLPPSGVILFHLFGECLAKKILDFKVGGAVSKADTVRLVKEMEILQDMIDRLMETGRQ